MVVAVTPSNLFNSAAVVVTAVPPIINLSLTISTSAPPAVKSLSALSSQSKNAPEVAPKSLKSYPVSFTPTETVASICTAPSMSTTSKFVVPAISTAPETSRVAASSSPVSVMLRKDAISLLASTITARDPATVPAVIPNSVKSTTAAPEPAPSA